MLKECILKSYQKVDLHTEKFRHFSYLIQGNTMLSKGTNCKINHTCIYPRNTYHAEFVAWMRGRKRINIRKPWYMINVRISKDMSLRDSKPCEICESLLSSAGCSKVIYTINKETEGCLHLN
jgi:deoxycytidylate deaminase